MTSLVSSCTCVCLLLLTCLILLLLCCCCVPATEGWWKFSELVVLPISNERVSDELVVGTVTYAGHNSRTRREDLAKNWQCSTEPKAKGDDVSEKTKSPEKNNSPENTKSPEKESEKESDASAAIVTAPTDASSSPERAVAGCSFAHTGSPSRWRNRRRRRGCDSHAP